MSLPGLDYGGRRPTMNAGRKRQTGDYGNSPQAAALRRQLARLASLEETDVYQELCAEADDRRRAESALPRKANGVVAQP